MITESNCIKYLLSVSYKGNFANLIGEWNYIWEMNGKDHILTYFFVPGSMFI